MNESATDGPPPMTISGARLRLADFLSNAKRCRLRPRPPVPASQVPILFQEPYILSGYRPVGQDWHCYLLSVFQRHNESVNIWTHLLAAAALLARWWAEPVAPGDAPGLAALPLGLFVASALAYLCCSVAAHLLQSRSELAHYSVFFLDYVGVAVYQYGSALGHYFYASEPEWRAGLPGPAYFPGAALLAWLSCAGCCFAKSYYRRPYPPARRICTLIPTGLAYLLVMSPTVHRLSGPWGQRPGLGLHAAHMALFLLSTVFFSCPVPERFLPGRCDFLGQGHQVFHVLLALCSLTQLEALLGDYARRRATVLEDFGEEKVWWACVLHPVVAGCCLLTALLASRRKRGQLLTETRERREAKDGS
ncbi:unnamed protein product [Lota lota]